MCLSRGNRKQEIKEICCDLLHCFALDETTGIKINPTGLVLGKVGIARDFYGWYRACEWRAAPCCKKNDMRTSRRESI